MLFHWQRLYDIVLFCSEQLLTWHNQEGTEQSPDPFCHQTFDIIHSEQWCLSVYYEVVTLSTMAVMKLFVDNVDNVVENPALF